MLIMQVHFNFFETLWFGIQKQSSCHNYSNTYMFNSFKTLIQKCHFNVTLNYSLFIVQKFKHN